MPDTVLLVHGWSVESTETYGGLHKAIEKLGYDIKQVHLGRYVSMDDRIRIEDLAKAMQNAIIDQLGKSFSGKFHIITHSTGGLVAREWFRRQWVPKKKPGKLGNFIFLASPHFGSRLAHHGRGMLAGIVKGGETGDRVLEQLELGSDFQWDLTDDLFTGAWSKASSRPFAFNVIGGSFENRGILARKILPASMEYGSDGTVRIAAGNLNVNRYHFGINANGSASFRQTGSFEDSSFLVLPDKWHSGKKGIMGSIKSNDTISKHTCLAAIAECLNATTKADYLALKTKHANATQSKFTRKEGKRTKTNKVCSQLVLKMVDDVGQPVHDYRVEILYIPNGAGVKEEPSDIVSHLHKNKLNPCYITMLLNRHRMVDTASYGVRVIAATGTDIVDYKTVEVVAKGSKLRELLQHNRTTQVEVVIPREPGKEVFRFHVGDTPDLHVKWNREGEIRKTGIKVK